MIMTRKLIVCFVAFICISASLWSQTKSNAEKMGYARTGKYWGPKTFYSFAPGTPNNKMANNKESAMRDLTGISETDFFTEIKKQGFTEVPKKEVKVWFNENKSKDKKFYYSPDKSYILSPGIVSLSRSVDPATGFGARASADVMRYVLIPAQDSLKVIEAIWQFLRDLNEMKVIMSSFASTFSKANPKAFPIEQAGASGWTSLRAGSFVLRQVDGKLTGNWERIEDIVRRTIGKPKFNLHVLGTEIDFGYSLRVNLKKEGYVLCYNAVAIPMRDLEPANNWTDEHKKLVEEYNLGLKGDKEAVNVYKKAPMPPVLEDLNKLLHIK